MFGLKRANVTKGRRPDEVGMVNDSMGVALWRTEAGADVRIGNAFKPRDGGSVVVKSTWSISAIDEWFSATRDTIAVLAHESSFLDEALRVKLALYAEAMDFCISKLGSVVTKNPTDSGLFS